MLYKDWILILIHTMVLLIQISWNRPITKVTLNVQGLQSGQVQWTLTTSREITTKNALVNLELSTPRLVEFKLNCWYAWNLATLERRFSLKIQLEFSIFGHVVTMKKIEEFCNQQLLFWTVAIITKTWTLNLEKNLLGQFKWLLVTLRRCIRTFQ